MDRSSALSRPGASRAPGAKLRVPLVQRPAFSLRHGSPGLRTRPPPDPAGARMSAVAGASRAGGISRAPANEILPRSWRPRPPAAHLPPLSIASRSKGRRVSPRSFRSRSAGTPSSPKQRRWAKGSGPAGGTSPDDTRPRRGCARPRDGIGRTGEAEQPDWAAPTDVEAFARPNRNSRHHLNPAGFEPRRCAAIPRTPSG